MKIGSLLKSVIFQQLRRIKKKKSTNVADGFNSRQEILDGKIRDF